MMRVDLMNADPRCLSFTHLSFFRMFYSKVALLGFLAVIGLSSMSTKKTKDTDSDDEGDDSDDQPRTPRRTPRKKESGPLGTIETPAGRRSARIRRRKET